MFTVSGYILSPCCRGQTHTCRQNPARTLPDWIVISLCTMLKGSFTHSAKAQWKVCEIKHKSGPPADKGHETRYPLTSSRYSTGSSAPNIPFPSTVLSASVCLPRQRGRVALCQSLITNDQVRPKIPVSLNSVQMYFLRNFQFLALWFHFSGHLVYEVKKAVPRLTSSANTPPLLFAFLFPLLSFYSLTQKLCNAAITDTASFLLPLPPIGEDHILACFSTWRF